MPTFAFLTSPPWLTPQLRPGQNAPLPIILFVQSQRFGKWLDVRLLSMPAPLDQ